MTGFVQVIEFRTSRIDELRNLLQEMRAGTGTGSAARGMVTKDRDRPGWYLNIVEFDSYESAMSNSARSDVSAFAARMATLCEEPPRFYNLDLVERWNAEGTSTSTPAALAGAAAAVVGGAVALLVKARQQVQERVAQRPQERDAEGTAAPKPAPPPAVEEAQQVVEEAQPVADEAPPPGETGYTAPRPVSPPMS